jgi:23S rRNA (guanosine2251-2'-O)-methyltransferase
MIIYGRNPVREALRGSRRVERIWATANAAREPWLAQAGVEAREGRRPRRSAPEVLAESAERIEALCGSTAHQGVCAEVSPFRYRDGTELLRAREPLIVALDQVQDPQNLGSVCRVAECAGAAGLVLPERRSATVTAAVCKASAGAVEHLALARVRNLVDFLQEAKAASLWCYGADAEAPRTYHEVELTGGVVLVLGSEGSGLRPRVAAACDLLVRIPLHGKISSLSVGTAAAVLLYGARRQRDVAPA